jgi:hypothetical protein
MMMAVKARYILATSTKLAMMIFLKLSQENRIDYSWLDLLALAGNFGGGNVATPASDLEAFVVVHVTLNYARLWIF